jgi:predicted HAD superfamily hydrolase
MDLEKYKIISFDIFDTLLLRPLNSPQDVWKIIEEQERTSGFYKDRKEADAITYKQASLKNGETSLDEAYSMIPQWDYLKEKELSLEKKIIIPNPEMVQIWEKAGALGKKRILISDMYLPKKFLEELLIKNGITKWDSFYLSCERNARKTTGKLFKIMLEEEQIAPSDVLHIGDNKHSDIEQPSKLGINTFHYHKVIEQVYVENPFLAHTNNQSAPFFALGWHLFKNKNKNWSYWHKLGFFMGGYLGYLYASWIASTAKKIDKEHLMFVARDGYLLKKICNAIYPEIKTDYFCAPRTTSIAVLGAIGSDPNAIQDRIRYLKSHEINTNQEYEKYKKYLNQFVIDENTAIVDGCSSGFSAQKLVEFTVDYPVFGFYILAMAKKEHTASLFSTDLYSMQFQNLVEFIFGAPSAPIDGVNGFDPIYKKEISQDEVFKMSVSEMIVDGAVDCAVFLHQNNVKLSASDWIQYSNAFMKYLTKNDIDNLQLARNATDVQQSKFNKITWKPFKKFDFRIEKAGRLGKTFIFVINNIKRSLTISRHGIKYQKKNMEYQIGRIYE